MAETIPTFVVSGTTIKEIGFTVWEETSPGRWEFISGDEIYVDGHANRIIFELPVGCYETSVYVYDGTVSFVSGGGGHGIVKCSGYRQFGELPKQQSAFTSFRRHLVSLMSRQPETVRSV